MKSLWDMETELRTAARKGILLNTGEAAAHLAEARTHLEQAFRAVSDKGGEPGSSDQHSSNSTSATTTEPAKRSEL